MAEPSTERSWWHEITRSDRFNRAEWMLLGVSASAFAGVVVVLVKTIN